LSKSFDMAEWNRVLLIDEARSSTRALLDALRRAGFSQERCASVPAACRRLEREPAIAVLRGELEDAEQLIRHAQALIVLSDFPREHQLPEGCEELSEPIGPEEIVRAVRRQAERLRLAQENRRLREAVHERFQLGALVSRDPAFERIAHTVSALADTRAGVLIVGESGTGKSLLARTIHQLSSRLHGPFVEVNCGALPANLLESELFGHVKGAFTGALRDREGKFEAAQGGTIFLDEIGVAPADLQIKLLRLLQERRFERIGESRTRETDARVIAATNADLVAEVRAGRFREDLYWRLHVVTLALPPLRERPRDILLLAEHFQFRFATEHNRQVSGFTQGAEQALVAHRWPGNVRELEHAIERAVLLSRGGPIDELGLGLRPAPSGVLEEQSPLLPVKLGIPLREALEEPEREIIRRTLEMNHGCRQSTARMLAVNRATLFNKMRKYALLDFPHKKAQS
jgi:two-component system response regulator HydG